GAVDISRPFSVHYATVDQFGNINGTASVDYQVPEIPLALATGGALPAELTVPDEGDDLAGLDRGTWANMIETAPWPAVSMLAMLMALVMASFLSKSAMLRWGTLALTLGYLGWFDGGFLSVSHITNGIKQGPAMFMTDLPTVMILLFTLITTLLWGRVFCSSLCPFGALQDFISRFLPRHFQKELPAAIHDKAIYIKYGILAFLIVGALLWTEVSLFQYFEPFGTIFYFSQSIVLWVILALMLVGTIFISRFYCRYLCPLGAALGVMSILSPLRIKRVAQCEVCTHCQHSCPTGAIRMEKIDFKECVRCDICEQKLIARSGVCKHSVDEVRSKLREWTPVTVS
ncbi:MAG: 4Fe-4S binding protein, partial [Gammaproteobacteria bacterium]